jgi:predicted transcriptional regulator of viral defense system
MNLQFLGFREAMFSQGIFHTSSVHVMFPGFNSDNLLNWQKKGYIVKLRNGWYCFREFLSYPDSHYLIANSIYQPSYISHQEALAFYGLIPEHVVDSVSVTTKKTMAFNVCGRVFKYYSVKTDLYFGYGLKDLSVNGEKRSFLMADPEKAILDLLYIYNFYRTDQDLAELRLNEAVLRNSVDWNKLSGYLTRFGIGSLEKKVMSLQKIYGL